MFPLAKTRMLKLEVSQSASELLTIWCHVGEHLLSLAANTLVFQLSASHHADLYFSFTGLRSHAVFRVHLGSPRSTQSFMCIPCGKGKTLAAAMNGVQIRLRKFEPVHAILRHSSYAS